MHSHSHGLISQVTYDSSVICLKVLAQSEDKMQQLIAVEAIASSATKQTAAKSIINLGMGVLKVCH